MRIILGIIALLLLSMTEGCTRTVYVTAPLAVPGNLERQAEAPTMDDIRCLTMETKVKIGKREMVYRSNIQRLIRRIMSTHE